MTETYRPSDFGKKEEDLIKKFNLQLDDAKNYFTALVKPRLDRSYKLYISDRSDRAKEIKKWQANVFVPYIHAVVETLKPRVLDARPDFSVQGRNQDDQQKAPKVQCLNEYTWEISDMDTVAEMAVDSSLIYGTGYMSTYWKKDVRELEFLSTKDVSKKTLKWVTKEQTFYDAPYAEWVDNYDLWYDWHNVEGKDKQFWFRRKVLNGSTIKRRYPNYDKTRLDLALNNRGGDLTDYAQIRNEVKLTFDKITKGSDYTSSVSGLSGQNYSQNNDPDLRMHEVFEWWRPFEDRYAVMVNGIPILRKAEIPIVYDFKEAPFIAIPYLKLPNEFEGYGIPMILESPQILLNTVKNQRIDAMTLNIHKMWVVNPLANINKEELVTRPFGIVYSTDPGGVREIQFSDIKASAYKEEELLKSDMRYGIGVDDFSMGVGGGASSATETRHLRESTLERVRMYINHLGSGFSQLMRYWISMYRQFFTAPLTIRIIGEDGKNAFPIIEKDDLSGEFDFKATVLPSLAGQQDVKKKQDMDLFQLLMSFVDPNVPPFIDPQKLVSKTLYDWNWDIESISTNQEQPPEQPTLPSPMAGAEAATGMPPEMLGVNPQGTSSGLPAPQLGGKQISPDVARAALAMLGNTSMAASSGFAQANAPINLLSPGVGAPPTVADIPTGNPRGLNRKPGGRVNTNIPKGKPSVPEENLLNRTYNIQR